MKPILLFFAVFSFPAFAGGSCPEYSAPHCVAGERLDVSKDDNGCNVASCVTAEPTEVEEGFQAICPAFEPVPCSKFENPSSILDGNGCKIATCEKLPD